jgi:methionyl-tRNA formyltransferase
VIPPPRIIFLGSPDFAIPALNALAAEYPIIAVITQPDRPAGRNGKLRPPPVKTVALDLGLPVIQPEKLRVPSVLEQLRAWSPDLIVVAAFGQILRPELLDLPKYGSINIHGSILPRWRGAAPVQAAILAGDAETGVTIMKMDAGIDTGPLLGSCSIPIAQDETAGTLFDKLAVIGANLLLETLPRYLSGELVPQPQPALGVTHAKMLKKEDGRLDFSQPASSLERRVRAMDPWPGAFFDWKGTPIKLLRARVSGEVSASPGDRVIVRGYPAIRTPQGDLILEEVQPAGKKPMDGKAFLAGARDWV